MMVAIGDMAPDAGFALADGTTATLAQWHGKPLVLFFYPKDDTSGCTTEAKAFSALLPDFKTAGVAVLGASRDSVASHTKFIAKHSLAIPLAADTEGALTEAFGVWVEKLMYGRSYMGIERATFLIGADGRIVQIWRKVKVPGHAESVLESARQPS